MNSLSPFTYIRKQKEMVVSLFTNIIIIISIDVDNYEWWVGYEELEGIS